VPVWRKPWRNLPGPWSSSPAQFYNRRGTGRETSSQGSRAQASSCAVWQCVPLLAFTDLAGIELRCVGQSVRSCVYRVCVCTCLRLLPLHPLECLAHFCPGNPISPLSHLMPTMGLGEHGSVVRKTGGRGGRALQSRVQGKAEEAWVPGCKRWVCACAAGHPSMCVCVCVCVCVRVCTLCRGDWHSCSPIPLGCAQDVPVCCECQGIWGMGTGEWI
jgi:hypothetical protein